jgi:hypothetical protein
MEKLESLEDKFNAMNVFVRLRMVYPASSSSLKELGLNSVNIIQRLRIFLREILNILV